MGAVESARVRTPRSRGPFSNASAIPATSPSHTVAPSQRYLPPLRGPASKESLDHSPATLPSFSRLLLPQYAGTSAPRPRSHRLRRNSAQLLPPHTSQPHSP